MLAVLNTETFLEDRLKCHSVKFKASNSTIWISRDTILRVPRWRLIILGQREIARLEFRFIYLRAMPTYRYVSY